ncbi:hypothetical protein GUJ93_ZPchr1067g16434 [Zizania palustris]|uniref:Uncharacterized protein n=1 Tax=Zizania palustris TaxID=103762 RepID=A0A8J5QPE6_ZIZPA|nr:hypothetical protein GUJ93_ZPchr1067g16434 [Zizania palustris]
MACRPTMCVPYTLAPAGVGLLGCTCSGATGRLLRSNSGPVRFLRFGACRSPGAALVVRAVAAEASAQPSHSTPCTASVLAGHGGRLDETACCAFSNRFVSVLQGAVELQAKVSSRCFFDVEIGGESAGAGGNWALRGGHSQDGGQFPRPVH